MFTNQRTSALILTSLLTLTALSAIVACGRDNNGDKPMSSASGQAPGEGKPDPKPVGENTCVAPFKLKEETLVAVDAEHPLAAGKYKASGVQVYIVNEENTMQTVSVSSHLTDGEQFVLDCNTISDDPVKATVQKIHFAFSEELDGATATLAGASHQIALNLEKGELSQVDVATLTADSTLQNLLVGAMPLEDKKISESQAVTARLFHVTDTQVELHALIQDNMKRHGHRQNRYARIVYDLQEKVVDATAAPTDAAPADAAQTATDSMDAKVKTTPNLGTDPVTPASEE